jgi:hypothetical protein
MVVGIAYISWARAWEATAHQADYLGKSFIIVIPINLGVAVKSPYHVGLLQLYVVQARMSGTV